MYAWHGRLHDDGTRKRAWMSAAAAAASREDGGLQLPCLRAELLLMSATTVRRWISAQDPIASSVASVLLHQGATDIPKPVAPARGPAPASRVCSTLAASGTSVLRAAACHPREPDEAALARPMLVHAGRAPLSEGSWVDGWYCRDFTRHDRDLQALAKLQLSRYDKLNVSSLLATPVLGQGLLLHASGRELTAADLPGLACNHVCVGDIIEMQWARQRLARFRLRDSVYPYPAVNSFRLLCDLLVMNYPGLLCTHEPPTTLVERTRSADRWSLVRDERNAVRLWRTIGSAEPQDLGDVESLPHAQLLASGRQEDGKFTSLLTRCSAPLSRCGDRRSSTPSAACAL
jgi:hypothetical protein